MRPVRVDATATATAAASAASAVGSRGGGGDDDNDDGNKVVLTGSWVKRQIARQTTCHEPLPPLHPIATTIITHCTLHATRYTPTLHATRRRYTPRFTTDSYLLPAVGSPEQYDVMQGFTEITSPQTNEP